jgi:hypothetical protein
MTGMAPIKQLSAAVLLGCVLSAPTTGLAAGLSPTADPAYPGVVVLAKAGPAAANGDPQALSCRWASRNHRYLSTSREMPVKRSAVSASPISPVASMAERIALPYWASWVDK